MVYVAIVLIKTAQARSKYVTAFEDTVLSVVRKLGLNDIIVNLITQLKN